MKKITLRQIKIEGFYGQTRTVNFSPTETVIRGDVKLGKTTIINAFMWCLLGIDLDSRANYMLYDQSVEYSRDFAGQARVEMTLDIDGQPSQITRTAKQKWQRDKSTDTWVKASSDEYRYYIDDLELTKGEFDAWIESRICPLKKLALIANIDQWRKHSWRTLREMFQSLVGEITAEDFRQDYSSVVGVIAEVGLEKAREQFQSRANKYDRQLEKLAIEEETTKRGLVGNDEINVAERRISEINAEIDELDRRQSSLNEINATAIARREEIAKEIGVKERLLRDESEAYESAHKERLRRLQDAYNEAVATNISNNRRRATAKSGIETCDKWMETLELQLKTARARYKETNAKLFDGLCPTCGTKLSGVSAKSVAGDFEKNKERILRDIKDEGTFITSRITQCATEKAQHERTLAELTDADEKAALRAYQKAEDSHVPYSETERGRQAGDEIAALREQMPEATWTDDIEAILHRKGELRIELQKQHEIYGQKLSNERTLDRLDEIARERASTVQAQVANAKTRRLIEEYERELAEIIRFRTNKLFPDRTEVIMTRYKKNGDIDFDVCQVEINGKDATATNTADRMNAGIDISTVFMRFHDIDFPLFVDGAESNTAIESYGRQIIKTVVDENCKTLTFDTL